MASKKTRRGRKGRKKTFDTSFNFGANMVKKGRRKGSSFGS
jgi:hypothetical protein